MQFQNVYDYGSLFPNPKSGCLFFPAPLGGRCPSEMKYTYPSTLGHVVSEYIWLWESISKTLGVIACFFPALSGGRSSLEMKFSYPSTLSHVVSEYT